MEINMENLLNDAIVRLKEPSTWASIAATLVALHFKIDPGTWKDVTFYGKIGRAHV